MEGLLDKIRAIKKLVQSTAGSAVDFDLIARSLSENTGANVYLVGRRGKILSYQFVNGFDCPLIDDVIAYSESFPESYNQQLQLINQTQANCTDQTNSCFFHSSESCPLLERKMTIIPIFGGGERLGTLILTKGCEFNLADLVLAESGATVVGLEIMRIITERVESDTKRKAAVQIALGTLSFSEIEAASCIFKELGKSEGLLVASRVADQVGITRSVIVNALRKLESAGVIEAKSLGMKGTYIRILNDNLLYELKRLRWSKKSQ